MKFEVSKNIKVQTLSSSPPQKTPEGFLLIDQDDAWSWGKFGFGLFFLLIWLGVSLPILIVALREIANATGPADWVGLLIPLLFTGLGLVGLLWFLRGLLMVYRIAPGELILSQWPLRMGETYQVRYRRQLRGGKRTTQAGQVAAKLVGYEWVRYRQGTDTRTDTSTFCEQSLPSGEVFAGSSKASLDFQFQIPLQGPPSFEASDNQIRWEIQVTLTLPKLVKDTSKFRLWVDPEVIQ